MKIIKLTQGYVCVVSKEDYKMLNKYSWAISRSGGKGRKLGEPYAATTFRGKKLYMHRLIMGEPKGLVVDHINNQTLDNRRYNLRAITQTENRRNSIDIKNKFRKK